MDLIFKAVITAEIIALFSTDIAFSANCPNIQDEVPTFMNCQYRCHCKDDAQCDEQTGTCSHGCDFGWMGPGCQYRNIVKNNLKIVRGEKGTSIPSDYGSVAVDGDDTTCSRTGTPRWSEKHYWYIQFDMTYEVLGLRIKVPSQDVGNFRNFRIETGSDWNTTHYPTLCYGHTNSSINTTMEIMCIQSLKIKQLRIKLDEPGVSLRLCEVEIYGGRSVTFNKHSSQISTYNKPFEWTASKAVDGRIPATASIDADRTCSATKYSLNPWWRVDLETPYVLYEIQFFGRLDRLKHFQGFYLLYSNSTDQFTELFHDSAPSEGIQAYQPMRININPRVTGKYLQFQFKKQNKSLLVVCEVIAFAECPRKKCGWDCSEICSCTTEITGSYKIYGICPHGCQGRWTGAGGRCDYECTQTQWGTTCQHLCGNCEGTQTCDLKTGECKAGCSGPWVPPLCTEGCPKFKYGINCTLPCGKCYDNTSCNSNDGTCVEGCQQGWKPPNCQTTCPDGLYGFNCSEKCGFCKNQYECDKKTGHCLNGCQAGYKGDLCKQRCDSGTFGFNCSRTCGHCINDNTCHFQTGICEKGCEAGFQTAHCNESCVSGTFGFNCSKECGHCIGDSTCHFQTGICEMGCKHGFQTSHCNESCVSGTFGFNCSKECGHCIGDSTCHFQTGICEMGCKHGFQTSHCNERCDSGTFGFNCSRICGHCINDKTCHFQTGICEKGCEAGFQTAHCNETVNMLYHLRENITTTMSSVSDGMIPEYAIHDWKGIRDPDTCQCCSRTMNAQLSWWKVDLQNMYPLKEIHVYGTEGDRVLNLLSGFSVYLANGSNEEATLVFTDNTTTDDDKGKHIDLSSRLARVVTIQRFGTLTLCSVSLIEGDCKPGYFGDHCGEKCHCADRKPCDKYSGHCQYAVCKLGWNGTSCNTECPSQTFGEDCNNDCFCKHDTCTHDYGICSGECQAGFKGVHCNEACSSGTFGEGCTHICHCKDATCTKDEGICPGGCMEGFDGEHCDNGVNGGIVKIAAIAGGCLGAVLVFILIVVFIHRYRIYKREQYIKENYVTPDRCAVQSNESVYDTIDADAGTNQRNLETPM